MSKFPIAILVSGNGTNLQAIIDSIEKKELNAQIAVVISDNANAFALKRCSKHNILSVVYDRRSFSSREEFEAAIAQTILESGAELICLAGFMRILSKNFVAKFPNKIINIHPALLPNFPGLHAQKQALDAGVNESGCTVHFVNEEVDAGPVILQAVVKILPEDTEETLTKRILEEEHKIYPQAIELFASGKMKIL